MHINWEQLVAAPTDLGAIDVLAEWRWLVPDDMSVVLVSSLGDAFLKDRFGAVHWLDAGAAKLHPVASTVAEFDDAKQQPENVERWFMPQLVESILRAGAIRLPGQVFSYKLPPTLNGKYEVDNFEPINIPSHFAMLGAIQCQVRDLADGTRIKRFI